MVKQQTTGSKVRLEIELLKSGCLVLEKEIEEGTTLKDLLNEIVTTHREVVEIAFDTQDQKLTGAMAIILNGSFIQLLNGLETKLSNGDVIAFIPLIVGG